MAMTIVTIAEALGLSKSTVSRALSGKGRIGEATKRRVYDYIESHEPESELLKSPKAKRKTYNIGVAIPTFSDAIHLPFFQRCLLGACDFAQSVEYNVLVVGIDNDKIQPLERLIKDKKVDGIILTRALVDDRGIRFLKKKDIPYIVVGSVEDKDVYQIDSDNRSGSKELTSYLYMVGMKKVGLIGGHRNHQVTLDRYEGFLDGVKAAGKQVDDTIIYLDALTDIAIHQGVKQMIRKGADCIVCMDDYICSRVLKELREVEETQVAVATLYDTGDEVFDGTSVFSLRYDPNELGLEAAKLLFNLINNKPVNKRTKLGYEVILRKSNKKSRKEDNDEEKVPTWRRL
ncbi:DNA-binding LacI/PurR family transcriptional regulator [Aequitasia blattaphilus]|uniref:LacI family transcriptional regulator n=1 Tax=Aequitasia blattaphilus TaxID=2949332 RepID=A0ABT1EFK3_9FIRM|nr:LacI family DNA-binding transcriptional regulator [Aequitasia blattaphilus]MCP1103237.1 LacI family transcriptional regulator [Aequitasia blattaphilus]MCR8615877.1 LacI family transcriptional regulator [Aequitasia blattaphilus]